MTVHVFKVGGLHCQGCVNSVQTVLKDVKGVAATQVDLASAEARIDADASFEPDLAIKAVQKAGFALTPA